MIVSSEHRVKNPFTFKFAVTGQNFMPFMEILAMFGCFDDCAQHFRCELSLMRT